MAPARRHLMGLALLVLGGCSGSEGLVPLTAFEYQRAASQPVDGEWQPVSVAPGGVDGRPVWYRVQVPALDAVDPAILLRTLYTERVWVGADEVDFKGAVHIVPLGSTPKQVIVKTSRGAGSGSPASSLAPNGPCGAAS